jgi:hypothetical protein
LWVSALQTEKHENASHLRLVGRYLPNNPHFCSNAPTLAASLAEFEAHPDVIGFIKRNQAQMGCLIQGYTAPCNAKALRKVLSQHGCEKAHVVAVDQIALPTLYEQLGAEMPEVEFVQADACDLGDLLGSRKFEMVIQDFILNCLPPVFAQALLHEARRHLRDDGLCLLSFSADARRRDCHPKPEHDAFAPWARTRPPQTRSLNDMARSDIELGDMQAHLLGATLLDPATDQILQVTAPSGQFEFFQKKAEIVAMIERAGFAVSIVSAVPTVDYSGLECTRYRAVAQPV